MAAATLPPRTSAEIKKQSMINIYLIKRVHNLNLLKSAQLLHKKNHLLITLKIENINQRTPKWPFYQLIQIPFKNLAIFANWPQLSLTNNNNNNNNHSTNFYIKIFKHTISIKSTSKNNKKRIIKCYKQNLLIIKNLSFHYFLIFPNWASFIPRKRTIKTIKNRNPYENSTYLTQKKTIKQSK